MARLKRSGRMYTMRVSLRRVTPQVWRRLEVPGDLTLEQFHGMLQIAFGWTNSHLYEFEANGERYGPRDEDEEPLLAPSLVAMTVDDLVREATRFTYTYDFGDNWVHAIRVERTFHRSEVSSRPSCLGGRNAAPPEDSGGPGAGMKHDPRPFDVELNDQALACCDLTAFGRGLAELVGSSPPVRRTRDVELRRRPN